MKEISHHVYRIYDANDVLIYIGATSNLKARMATHRSMKPWPGCAPVVTVGARMARWTSTEYPTRADAFAAERAAIRAERPELNTNSKGVSA